MIKLNLLQYKEMLTIRKLDEKTFVWDPVRKKNVVMSPEEMVRQLLILYFSIEKGYKIPLMAVEKEIEVNRLQKRFDLLLFNVHHEPQILVECKSPNVNINADTFKQLSWYNMSLRVPFLLITNGIDSFAYRIDFRDRKTEFISELPEFEKNKPDINL